jgi:hypothetical protein
VAFPHRFSDGLHLLYALLHCTSSTTICSDEQWFYRAPESPRWLAKVGRHDECLATLAALENTTVEDEQVLRTYRGILGVLAAEQQGGFSFRELTTHGKSQNFRRTAIGMLSQCFQQITGIK